MVENSTSNGLLYLDETTGATDNGSMILTAAISNDTGSNHSIDIVENQAQINTRNSLAQSSNSMEIERESAGERANADGSA